MASSKKKNRKPKSSLARKRRLARSRKSQLSFQSLEPKQLLAAVTVGNTTDLVNANVSSISSLIANNGGDGISLREAIEAANNTVGEDTITFDANVFTDGNNLIRLTQGQLLISESLSIDATSVTDVVITGDANNDDVTFSGTHITDVAASFGSTSGAADDLLDDNSRVLDFTAGSGNLTLTGLTITGGRTTEGNAFYGFYTTESGGGIRATTGDVTLINSTVSGNSTLLTRGGGISIRNSGDLTLLNSTVSDNSSYNGGGGIDTLGGGNVTLTNSTVSGNSGHGGIRTNGSDVTLTNSTVSGNNGYGITGVNVTLTNSSVSGNGRGVTASGIFADDITLINSSVNDNIAGRRGGGLATLGGEITLINSSVSGNSVAGNGGGIYLYAGNLFLTDGSTISGNSSGGDGGGIFSYGHVSLVSSTVSGNSSLGDGGGIRTADLYRGFGPSYTITLISAGSVSLTDSTVSGNSASNEGGGIASGRGNVLVTNSTVSGNDSADGGGIFSTGGLVALTNSTVSDNSASNEGGGISLSDEPYADTMLTLSNSIVAGSTDNGSAPDVLAPVEVTQDLQVEHSLIGDTTGTGITAATGIGNILNQPALLGPLADNGGPTLTHALLPSSPAIDAGSNPLALDQGGAPLTTDQRGEARVADGTVDIGAYEFADPFLLGDVNLNGVINFLDIQPFIDLLVSNAFLDEADIDRDGSVTFLDINPFISILASVGSAESNLVFNNSIASAISSGASVTTQAIVDEAPASSAVSLVAVVEPESAATVEPTADASHPLKVSLDSVRASDLLALPVEEPNKLPTLDTTVAGVTPVNIYAGPVGSAPVEYSFLSSRDPSLRGPGSSGPLVASRPLKGDSARLDLTRESIQLAPSASVSIERSFSTAAELFDEQPESLDGIFEAAPRGRESFLPGFE